MKKMKNECIELIGEEKEEIHLEEYLKFCEYVLEYVKSQKKHINYNLYANFINGMKAKYLNKPFDEKLLSNEISKSNKEIKDSIENKQIKDNDKIDLSENDTRFDLSNISIPLSRKKDIIFIINIGMVGSGKF